MVHLPRQMAAKSPCAGLTHLFERLCAEALRKGLPCFRLDEGGRLRVRLRAQSSSVRYRCAV